MTQDLLQLIAKAPPMEAKLAALRGGDDVVFPHVVEAARAFLAALVAREAKARVWMVCANVRAQEALHNEVVHWFPEALFFPEADLPPVEGALPDPESAAERLGILQRLGAKKGREVVVLTRASIEEKVAAPDALRKLAIVLKRAAKCDRDALIRQLAEAGYEHVPQVSARGQFAVRGGILDIYSFHHTLPVRIEFFGDEIESLRHFDLDAQTSVQHVESCTLLLGESGERTCPLRDYIGEADWTIDVGGDFFEARVRILEGSEGDGDLDDGVVSEDAAALFTKGISLLPDYSPVVAEDFSTAFFEHGLGEFEAGDFVVDEAKRERFFAQLREWRLARWSVHIFCNNEGEIERLREIIPAVEADALEFVIGTLAHGFAFPAAKIAVLSDAELFGRYRNTRARRMAMRRAREVQGRSPIDFSELTEDDHVVHLEHGIGRYEGLKEVPRADGAVEEVLVVAFANHARIYVPLEQSFLLSRYVGVGKRNPQLSVLGDGKWARAKQSAEKAVFDYAARLLQVHAERETAQGFAFPPDNKWQREFESSFLFKETADQITAIHAAKTDMESDRPMDRLICGDVGFGKTEVAIRAAFKAVMGGKQVAVLAPTTVLAQQHYQTFRERMSDYPVTVDSMSRFRTAAEQRKTLEGLKNGEIDIVIGTHRLISKDIFFHNLGLVVIDEEQRFGVLHKERFKEMFKLVDQLTLSATPIPRTLYLSLMGAKDMSTIETPPANRIPTETLICPYDERVIREAINRELARQGQVYFLHNRVHSIEKMREKIALLCPQARIVIGHGQMEEGQLEEVMQRFVAGEADVLISTTIIESGLDIPNANTIIIDRADRFGLADLYQLRGRVGRGQHKAYAYLMLPREMLTVGEARKRINAIKQYSALGAGFKIAMRDLEIRGAGNILGTQQSGHIINIGFELYCGLLKQAVSKLKGERSRKPVDVVLALDFVATREAEFIGAGAAKLAPAFLPTSYIAESQPRIQAYRRLNELSSQEALDGLKKAWRDRFGKLPEAVANLLLMAEIKLAAAARKFTTVAVREGKLMLTRSGDYVQIGGKFPRLNASTPGEQLKEVLKVLKAF